MKAKAKLLKIDNRSGVSGKTGKDYDMDFGQFLDLETFDKASVLLSKDEVKSLQRDLGKEGLLEVGVDAKTDKITFLSFRVAA